MKITIGKEGTKKSWQDEFPEVTDCVYCAGKAKIGFVAHEGIGENFNNDHRCIASLYENKGKGSYWLHDFCAVAVYFCVECLEPTALYNQG